MNTDPTIRTALAQALMAVNYPAYTAYSVRRLRFVTLMNEEHGPTPRTIDLWEGEFDAVMDAAEALWGGEWDNWTATLHEDTLAGFASLTIKANV